MKAPGDLFSAVKMLIALLIPPAWGQRPRAALHGVAGPAAAVCTVKGGRQRSVALAAQQHVDHTSLLGIKLNQASVPRH